MMKFLLAAVNARYIHTSPAVRSLAACAGGCRKYTEIAEYTINQLPEKVLADIYRRKPDVLAFSCYIWNIGFVKGLIRDIGKVLPGCRIWAGGPEVSYDCGAFLEEFPETDLVMYGEGEDTFRSLAEAFCDAEDAGQAFEEKLSSVRGIVYRGRGGNGIFRNPPAVPVNLDEIPFLYEDLASLNKRILYYESSRGCPFSCSYCLSSVEKRVRFRSTEKVKEDLQIFLDARVPQVKFVDRTFNCSHAHAMEIWKYIKEHDNLVTNFHFEIAADLLDEEEIRLLSGLRPGQVQLEIGVQTTNPDTIKAITRKTDLVRLAGAVEAIHRSGRIHQHLDLIAGLPFEDYESFGRSFDDVYRMEPDQLQMGFLKVLKGSAMYADAVRYGIRWHNEAPYEVLSTPWLDYGEILRLKEVEEMLEVYRNSRQFDHSIRLLEGFFERPFALFEALAEHNRNWLGEEPDRAVSRPERFDILLSFAEKLGGDGDTEAFILHMKETLLLDLYLRENSRKRPAWAGTMPETAKRSLRDFYRNQEAAIREGRKEEILLSGYEGCDSRQLSHMTHAELFVTGPAGNRKPVLAVFDYRNRDPLTGNAGMLFLPFPGDPEEAECESLSAYGNSEYKMLE